MHVQRGENVPEGEQANEERVEQEEPVEHVQNNEHDLLIEAQQPVQLCHSGKMIHKPMRYVLLGKSYQVITIDNEEDPINYNEASKDVDAQEWHKAMNREMESMYSNSVWSLVEAPKGIKTIGCK